MDRRLPDDPAGKTMNPGLSGSELRSVEVWTPDHASRYHQVARHIRGRKLVDISPEVSPMSARLLLDAGADHVFQVFSETGPYEREGGDWQGLDQSYASDVSFVRGDMQRPPLKKGSLDTIVALFLLGSPERAKVGPLESISDLLRPGGLFITAVTNSECSSLPLTRWGRPFSPSELEAELRVALKDVRILGQKLRQEGQHFLPPEDQPRYSRLIDPITRLFRNRGFHPGEFDFRFTQDTQGAPFLFATGTPRSGDV